MENKGKKNTQGKIKPKNAMPGMAVGIFRTHFKEFLKIRSHAANYQAAQGGPFAKAPMYRKNDSRMREGEGHLAII